MEYNALVELNVRFGNDGIELLRKAYLQVQDRNIMNDTSRTNFSVNIEGGAAAVTSHLYAYASDSDSDSDSDDEYEEGK